ncbi:hypothetical protein [Vulcanisaeta distributa]|uniref:hypothetical protein n=1 Tax=Vulcanisaeta distributa TaxID=164451 RepID=UPI0006CF20AF|nr:hypothetical protein [Vulcanisaeta distributa]
MLGGRPRSRRKYLARNLVLRRNQPRNRGGIVFTAANYLKRVASTLTRMPPNPTVPLMWSFAC